jgi:hypothetical protein
VYGIFPRRTGTPPPGGVADLIKTYEGGAVTAPFEVFGLNTAMIAN